MMYSEVMKGVILAGGLGTRIHPLTLVCSKQLLPIYDKPLIYFPLCTLMELGVRDVLIITTPHHNKSFTSLLQDGSQYGISISYVVQPEPRGLAQGISIAEDFIGSDEFYYILGDNLFYGDDISTIEAPSGLATIYIKQVKDPEHYGVVKYDTSGNVVDLIEKPQSYVSSDAVVGLYKYDANVFEKVAKLVPSARGELEITDLNREYLKEGKLKIMRLSKFTTWFDTGGFEQLHDAASFVRGMQERTGVKICEPLMVAKLKSWI